MDYSMNYAQPYCYGMAAHPGYAGGYYSNLFIPHQHPTGHQWAIPVIPVCDSSSFLNPETPSWRSSSTTVFSPDAPEFTPSSSVAQNPEGEMMTKKKKRKKKKKAKDNNEPLAEEVLPAEPPQPKPQKEAEKETIKEPGMKTYQPVVKQYSILSRKNQPAKEPGLETKDSSWPALGRPAMSFADKLKSKPPEPAKSHQPFLDWRDQRTGVIPPPPEPPEKSVEDEEEGFVQVIRKKSKPLAESDGPDAAAKKKADRERKKLREKEKKRRAREEKLLAEKLMPKSQKIGLITPQVMEKWLNNSGRNASSSSNKPSGQPIKMDDEELFPSLGESSEWETTQVKVIQASKPAVVVHKAVKRSDPIQFDLMALIAKKTTKKPSQSDGPDRKKTTTKARQGVVANVLDRSAPVLSRGKIRTKKRKLSEIRKALLAAKAKKKLQGLVQQQQNPTGPAPKQLHTKRFREYCDQILTDEIDTLSRDMLYHLRTFQDRAYKKDPIKGKWALKPFRKSSSGSYLPLYRLLSL